MKQLIIVVVILLTGLAVGSLIENHFESIERHKLWLEHQELP